MIIAKKAIMISELSGVSMPMKYKKQDQITMIDTKVKQLAGTPYGIQR